MSHLKVGGGGSEDKGGPTFFWEKNAKIPQPSPPPPRKNVPSLSLGKGWALREETKKASRFDDKKKVYLENKVQYWPFIKKESGRRGSTVG